MNPRYVLRVEGLAVLIGALVLYFELGGPLWLLALVALAPDISMAAYLAGPRIGSTGYNLAHTYALPLALGGLGVWLAVPAATLVAAVWAGHIGADRLLGYGLKYRSGFKDTHLSTQPAPVASLESTR
jgi:hypothetical protein